MVMLLSLAAASARADGKKGKPPELATFTDANAKISFPYPKSWRTIVVADDGTKAEARNESGNSKMTIEALPTPTDGKLDKILRERLPGGHSTSVGDWSCVETDRDNGAHYSAFCAHHQKTPDLVLVIGVASSQTDFGPANRREFIVNQMAKKVSGFRTVE
jgi:hypothetical protein